MDPSPPAAPSCGGPTCLFTGEVLTAATKAEHTIPESLGGRIVSKLVSSTAFNERASNSIDHVLAQAYLPLYNRLGPLTPNHAAPAKMMVELPATEGGRYAFEPGGVLKLQGIRVLERDANDRPKVVEAADESALRRLAKSMGVDPAKLQFSERLTTTEHVAFSDFIPIAREIELGQLKAILLTFDALIGPTAKNFTRHPLLAPVREMLRSAVIDRVPPGYEEMNRFVLGLQYDCVDRIRRLRARTKFPHTPFEHVMVATGNAATRTLDAAWLLFDSAPVAFRLCNNWSGDAFTCVIVSAVKRDGETHGPFWYGGEGLLLPYTDLRSHPTLVGASKDVVVAHMQKQMERVAREQREAHQRAIDYVERHCDEFVANSLAVLTRIAGGEGAEPRPVRRGLELRLARMFHLRLRDNANAQRVLDEATRKHIDALPEDVRRETIAADDKEARQVSWACWLRAERAILDDVKDELGLPGDVITRSVTAVADVPGTRTIGMPPPVPSTPGSP